MVSEYETTSETTEPQRKSFIPWLILIVLLVLAGSSGICFLKILSKFWEEIITNLEID